MERFIAVLLCLTIPSLAQELALGAKGGLRLTGDEPRYAVASNSRRYIVGPTIEVGLPFHFTFEADALYTRLGNTFYIPLIANESDIRTIANSWMFPLLLKYRFPESRIRPFVSAGFAPRYASGSTHVIHYGYNPSDVTLFSVGWRAHDHAFAFGGGIDVRIGRIRIEPELRYLSWHVPSLPSPSDTAYYLHPPHSGEAQLLVGIGWTNK